MADLLYLSWGGAGRAATLRAALGESVKMSTRLVYLAVLDDSSFADVDDATRNLAVDELSWLLDTQVELAKSQLGFDDAEVAFMVRSGEVFATLAESLEGLDVLEILIGAPVPTGSTTSVEELLHQMSEQLKIPARVLRAGD